MSNQASWAKWMDSYRYSQDDRMLSYKYEKELEPKFEAFSNAQEQKTLLVGEFDVVKEPWRCMAIKSQARKFSFKVVEKEKDSVIEYTVCKQKLSRINSGLH
jgi:hypothetical protein